MSPRAPAVADLNDAAYNAWLAECERVALGTVPAKQVEASMARRAAINAREALRKARWHATRRGRHAP